MYIDKIDLNNFRIYYGENIITIAPSSKRNVCVISGDNGYGKTTLLTALVWCLYGNQMQEIDNVYKKRIIAAGGYRKYLLSTLNRRAASNGEKTFSVSIELKNLELPGIQCETLRITRQCDISRVGDRLSIIINNQVSELVDDLGQQVFINDFILPKEIAKFFFFDAEKIVEIAEMQSIQDRRVLSQAYSEVLGLKKYEELKNGLNDLRVRFRKDSVTGAEKKQFEELRKEIIKITNTIDSSEQEKESLVNERNELKIESNMLQEKLLREGNTLTIPELQQLRSEKQGLQEENNRLDNEFKDLLEYAPFAMNASLLLSIKGQLDIEDGMNKSTNANGIMQDKIKLVVNKLASDNSNVAKRIDDHIKQYYIKTVNELLKEHMINSNDKGDLESNRFIHDFSLDEKNRFEAMLLNLRKSYQERLKSLLGRLKINRRQFSDVSKRLANSESLELDELINNIRSEKDDIDKQINVIEGKTLELSEDVGALRNNLVNRRRLFEQISNKIEVNEKYQDKDRLATRLMHKLDAFITQMKAEKKSSLETKILSNLNVLMHKKDFVDKVLVEVDSEILDICLVNKRGEEIRKDDLSKGEQQLYATAILKSLVEESGVDFPVFIDSPLQKFDDRHAKNIIMSFYPYISSQVVILPLLNRELSKREYELLSKYVASVYSIENYNEDSSRFIELAPRDLFNEEMVIK